jgi:signal transduction histidine kinase
MRDDPTDREGALGERESDTSELTAGRFDELLTVVSHDLKSPLSAIMMTAASLMRMSGGDERTPQIVKKAESIQRSAERMARMIDDLHDFASMQSGRFALECSAQDPGDLVTSVARKFAPTARERGVELRSLASPELPPITCDRERIEQVLSNLLANALRVTDAGGCVSIGAERSGEDVMYFVEDGGPGIGVDQIANIFEQSRRDRHSAYKGMGLALPNAKGVVEAHQGRIWVDSEPGSPTRFSFTVPITAVAEQRSIA